MSSRQIPFTAVAYGAVGGILAAALFVVAFVLTRVTTTSQTFNSTSTYVRAVVAVVAFVGAAVAILGILAAHRTSESFGQLGAIGGWLAAAGYLIVALHNIVGMIAGDSQIAITVRIVAAYAVMIGSALLGVMTIRARILPWWCGVLLIVAFPLGDAADEVVAGGESVLLALLWASVGVALLNLRTTSSAPARVRAPAR